MKGLTEFIKNNKIIYKISVIGLVLMMLISVVLFFPDREEKNTVTVDELNDYHILYYPQNNAIYKGETWQEMDSSIGITCEGKDENGIYILRFKDVDFTTTDNVGLTIWDDSGEVTDVHIILEGENKINVLDNYKQYDFWGIANWQGSLTFSGDGSLDVSVKGYSGMGIYASHAVNIESGTIYAYGGTKGETAGINGYESVNISGGNVYAQAFSNDAWVGGIETGRGGNGDSVSITGGKVSINIGGDIDITEDTKTETITSIEGAAIDSGRIVIDNCELNIQMSGMHKKGLYSAASVEGNGVFIQNNAKVKITGDTSRGNIAANNNDTIAIYANSNDIQVDDAIVDIDLRNTKDETIGYAISTYSGDVNFNKGAIVNISNTSGIGVNVSGRLNINGGHLTVQSSGKAIAKYNNIVLGRTENSYTGVINVATDYEGLQRQVFDPETCSYKGNYKYMEIGDIYDFSLYVDSDGVIYKNSVSDDNILEPEVQESIGINSEFVDGVINVTLDNMQFATSKANGIIIDGETKINLVNNTHNSIVSTYSYSSLAGFTYGMSSGIEVYENITFDGGGTLKVDNIYKEYQGVNNNKSSKVGISGFDITIDNGNILIYGIDDCYYAYGLSALGMVDVNNGNLEIHGGNNGSYISGINIHLSDQTCSIDGGKVLINLKDTDVDETAGKITGIDYYNLANKTKYIQNAGTVKINIEGISTYGMDYVKTMTINDGSFEVSASKISSTTPTMSNKLGIAKVLDCNGNLVASPALASFATTSYSYAKIIPNYYLIYMNGGLYTSYDFNTEVTVSNCDVSDGKIVMDGFEFETLACCVLQSLEDVTIELAAGSKNKINMNFIGNDESAAIYGGGNIKIDGAGYLDIDSNSNTKLYGIYVDGALNIEHSMIDVDADTTASYSYGIFSEKDIIIDYADIKVRGTCKDSAESNTAIGATTSLQMHSSDVDINLVKGKNLAAIEAVTGMTSINNDIDITCTGTIEDGGNVKGMNLKTSGVMDILCDKIDVDLNGYDAYGLYAETNINIANSKYVDIDMSVVNRGCGIDAETGSLYLDGIEEIDVNISEGKVQGVLYGDTILSSIDTYVYAEFSSSSANGVVYAIGTEAGMVTMDKSDVDLVINSGTWSDVRGLYCHYTYGSITVNNTSMDIEGTSTHTSGTLYGIYSLGQTVSLLDDSDDYEGKLSVDIDSNYNGCGIYLGNTESALIYSDVQCYVDAFGTNNGIGIYLYNGMSVTGGEIISKGNTYGIYMAKETGVLGLTQWYSGCGFDYDTRVLEVSTSYEDSYNLDDIECYPDYRSNTSGTDSQFYSSADRDFINQYKYIMIGEVARYGLRYDVATKTMYKDYVTGYKASEVIESGDDIYGWSISDDGKLILGGFTFRTSMPRALNIVGDGTIEVKDDNRIGTIYVDITDEDYLNNLYGIFSSGNLTMTGTGSLEMVNERHNYDTYEDYGEISCTFNSIYSAQDLFIKGGKYRILASENICNGISAASVAMDATEYLIDVDIDIQAKTGVGIVTSTGGALNVKDSNIDIDITGITDYAKPVNNIDIYIRGLDMKGDVIIDGGKLEVKVDCPKYSAYSIYVKDNMIIKNAAYVGLETSTCEINMGGGMRWYGGALEIEENLSIYNSRLEAYYTNEQDEGSGIVVFGKMISNAAEVVAKGTSQALHVGDETNSSIIGNISAGSSYNGSNKTSISFATLLETLSSYKYIEIDVLNDFYLLYDASDRQMYKNGDKNVPVTTSEVPGWSSGDDGELILNGFNFVTSSSWGLELSEDTNIVLTQGSENSITTLYSGVTDEDEVGSCGIYSNESCTMTGEGTLNIGVYRVNNSLEWYTSRGITSVGSLAITDVSSLNITAFGGNSVTGIYTESECNLTNTDVKVELNSDCDITYADGYGIRAISEEHDVVIQGGSIDVDVDTACWGLAYGIVNESTDIRINNAVINVDGDSTRYEESYATGIVTDIGSVNIVGGEIYTNTKGAFQAYGISSKNNINLNDVDIVDIDVMADDMAIGIESCEGATTIISVASMDINIIDALGYMEGIASGDGFTATNSTIKVSIGTSVDGLYGGAICSSGEVMSITGGKITIDIRESNWGEATGLATWADYNSEDVWVGTPINISNADIKITGIGCEYSQIYGICSWGDDVNIDGSAMDINITSASEIYAINADDTIKIFNITQIDKNSIYVEGKDYCVTLRSDEEDVIITDVVDIQLEANSADWIEAIYAANNYKSIGSNVTINVSTESKQDWAEVYGVYVSNNSVDITGGTTNVTSKLKHGANCVGISVKQSGALFKSNDATIIVNVDSDAYSMATAIEADWGEVYIYGGTIEATADSAYETWGIYGRYRTEIYNMDKLDITLTGGGKGRVEGVESGLENLIIDNVSNMTINVSGGRTVRAVMAYENVSITDVTTNITCSSNENTGSADGIYAINGNTVITRGSISIDIPSTSKGYTTTGITSYYGDIEIYNATIDIDINSTYEGEGIGDYIDGLESFYGNVLIQGGSVTIKSVCNNDSWGIYGRYTTSISGVTKLDIDVKGERSAYGIEAANDDLSIANITESTIKVCADTKEARGITSGAKSTITSVNLDITCKSSSDTALEYVDGINSLYDVTITGGTINIAIQDIKAKCVGGVNILDGNVTINDVDLVVNIACIYDSQKNNTAIDCESGTVTIEGGSIDIDVTGKQSYIEGIYAIQDIYISNIDTVDIDVVGKDYVNGLWVESTGEVSLYNVSSININASGGTYSYGIQTQKGDVNIDKTDLVVVADTMALNPSEKNHITTKGIVYASTETDGQISEITKDTLYSKYNDYKMVRIDYEDMISVEIYWGKLEYTCKMSDWDTQYLKYNTYNWTCADGADIITVSNSEDSIKSVNVDVEYTPSASYSFITGNILEQKKTETEEAVIYAGPKVVEEGKSMSAYLELDGYPTTYFENEAVGQVTVTLSE